MKSFVLFAAAAAALSAAPAAFADDPQAVITYQQSQLTSIQGVAALRAEIREAAEDVCVTSDFPSLSERRAQASCVQSAIEAGEAQLRQKLPMPAFATLLKRLPRAQPTPANRLVRRLHSLNG